MKKPSAIIEAMQRYVDGHINETMELHKFHHWTNSKDACMQKSIRDQIIEGMRNGDTMEGLLQESELMLATSPNFGAKKWPRRTGHR